MWTLVVRRLVALVREVGAGIDAGHAVRLGLAAPERAHREPAAAADAALDHLRPRPSGIWLWWTDASKRR